MKSVKRLVGLTLVSTAVFFAAVGCFASSADPCELPSDLRAVIEKSHPNKKVVRLEDLSKYAQELYEKDHGSGCPGLVKVDFYGDSKPTWAVVLFGPDSKSVNGIQAVLVLAHKSEVNWKVQTIETTNGIPVVWKQKPGKYKGVYGDKTIRAQHSVIVFCGYSSWAVLCAWTDTHVSKIWLSD